MAMLVAVGVLVLVAWTALLWAIDPLPYTDPSPPPGTGG